MKDPHSCRFGCSHSKATSMAWWHVLENWQIAMSTWKIEKLWNLEFVQW